jgi:radical SAM superfamily enzyme YgiQ (UPF0313 family)
MQQDKDIVVKTVDAENYYYNSVLINRSRRSYWEKILDLQNRKVAGIDEENKRVLDEIVNIILAERPNAAGFSVTNQNLFFTRYVSMRLKEKDSSIYIVYGGLAFCHRKGRGDWIAGTHKEFPYVDCIVKNEGEETLLEVAKCLKSGKKPGRTRGATIRAGMEILDGGERALIKDLDSIPFPDFSDFKKADYISDYARILFWRGCVGRCVYCGENYTMGTIRCRSAKNIIDEIKLRLEQGYRKLQTCDLCLNPSASRLAEVCSLIVKEGLDVDFTFGQFRHSPDMTREMFRLIGKAGFKTVVFGTESGSQSILDRMNKGVEINMVEKNIRDAHKEKLRVVLFLMVGFPGETEKTFLETVRFIKRNRNYIDAIGSVNTTSVPGGSGFEDNLQEYSFDLSTLFRCPDRWETSDGGNNYEWREGLKNKMAGHLLDFGIPMVNYHEDGNPGIPASNKMKIYIKRALTGSQERLPQAKAKKHEGAGEYSANIHIVKVSVKSNICFFLDITNTGRAVWKKELSDWIRAGCRVYGSGEKINPVLELRQDLPCDIVERGRTFRIGFTIDAALLKDSNYRVKFDMVNERKFWFEDTGEKPVVRDISLKHRERNF